MKSIKGESLRFLIAGGANTVLTYLIYIVLLYVVSYPMAFTITFIIGVIIAFIFNSFYVFRAPLAWSKFLQYPIIYALQYVVGLALLALVIEYIGFDKRIAPIFNVILLTPVTFVLNKCFLSRRANNGAKKCE
jgi:putative flippase GtrA